MLFGTINTEYEVGKLAREFKGGSLLALKCLVWFMKYYANVRRTVADFSHAPLNEYSPSPDDKKQWSLVWDVGLGGSRFRNFAKKESMKKAFQDMLHELGGNEENSEDNFSCGSALEDYITLLFVLVRNIDFQDSPDDEEDTRSSHEYLNDLEEEYQVRALLAKSKRFFKKGTQSSPQHKPELRPTKDFEAKYNKVKAKLALLSSSASASKASTVKNKALRLSPFVSFFYSLCLIKSRIPTLITEAYEWDEEEVSSDDNEIVEVKVLMALAEDTGAVSKKAAKNDEWVKISMRKVHTLLEIEDNDDRKTYLDYLCIDLNYVEEQKNNLLSKHRDLVHELNACKEQLLVLKQAKLDFLTMQHVNTEILKENKNLRILPAESQRNTTDPSFAVTDSSATDYDSVDESSVCSTPLHPLKKIDGVEPISRPKTIKSILRCEKTDQRTCDHAEYISTLNMSQHLKSLGRASSRSKIPRPSKRFFPPCTHCGYIDHLSNECLYYPICGLCGSYDHDTNGHNRIISLEREINPRNPQHAFKRCKVYGSSTHTTTDHYDIKWFKRGEALQAKDEALKSTKAESSNANRSKTPTKRETIFNSNKEVVMIAPGVRDVYVLDITSSAPESCFFAKAYENLNWLWHKRLAYLNFKTINKLAKQNLVIGLPSLVYSKDKPCSSCKKGKASKSQGEVWGDIQVVTGFVKAGKMAFWEVGSFGPLKLYNLNAIFARFAVLTLAFYLL
ncbi:retrovirus-related pol polyprotein from transposon TNT 1-94 [Tanacetum coccineum]|uniref:Retrovirus-related pol polyprotein from transposon TNT 1-94 n=1 Tax=Tanacetum coccineum TaxID=301880 RepID=A0ABQ5FAR3_9ASTR